jgi:hypothetical protein
MGVNQSSIPSDLLTAESKIIPLNLTWESKSPKLNTRKFMDTFLNRIFYCCNFFRIVTYDIYCYMNLIRTFELNWIKLNWFELIDLNWSELKGKVFSSNTIQQKLIFSYLI